MVVTIKIGGGPRQPLSLMMQQQQVVSLPASGQRMFVKLLHARLGLLGLGRCLLHLFGSLLGHWLGGSGRGLLVTTHLLRRRRSSGLAAAADRRQGHSERGLLEANLASLLAQHARAEAPRQDEILNAGALWSEQVCEYLPPR